MLTSPHYGSVNESTDRSWQLESPPDYKARWRTIRVLYLTMFFSSVGFSIVMSSLWPFLEKVDPKATPEYLGWVNAAYSLSQLFGSVLLGTWCQYRPSAEPLTFSLIVFMAGSGLYAFVQAFPSHGGEMILVSRVLLGFCGGNAAIARAVISQSTTLLERSSAMANLAVVQAVGFTIGPGMQAACEPLGDKGSFVKSLKLYLNIYTAPGYLGMIMALINIVAVIFFYRERTVDIYAGQEERKIQTDVLEKPDPWAIFLSTLIFFVILTVFALNETIMTPLLMDEFAWTKTQTVLYVGIMLAVSGLIAIVAFSVVKPLSERYGERRILVSGLLMILAGFIVYLPWGNKYPPLQILPLNNNSIPMKSEITPLGCPSNYGWCESTPKLYLPQFLVGATLVGTGYPVAFLVISTIYSRILGPRPQGIYMGWITATGSLARCVGPVMVTAAYVEVGPRWTFFGVDIMMTLSILTFAILYDKLIPFHEYVRKKVSAPLV